MIQDGSSEVTLIISISTNYFFLFNCPSSFIRSLILIRIKVVDPWVRGKFVDVNGGSMSD